MFPDGAAVLDARSQFIVAGVLVVLAMPVRVDTQGVVGGAEQGATKERRGTRRQDRSGIASAA